MFKYCIVCLLKVFDPLFGCELLLIIINMYICMCGFIYPKGLDVLSHFCYFSFCALLEKRLMTTVTMSVVLSSTSEQRETKLRYGRQTTKTKMLSYT